MKPHLPCKLCEARGFECTMEQKKWGPRKEDRTAVASLVETRRARSNSALNRTLPLFDSDMSSTEWRNLEFFCSLWVPERYAPRRFPSALGTRAAIPLYNVGIGLVSKLYRTAVLVLTTYLRDHVSDQHTFEYLARFYQQARICIKNQSVLELVYASYLIAVYALLGGPLPGIATDHCSQFCRSFVALQMGSQVVGEDEFLWLETLWQRILSSLYYVHRDNLAFDLFGLPILSVEFDTLQQLLSDSSCLLPSEGTISRMPSSITAPWLCQKIYSLSIYAQFYWDWFLIQETFVGACTTRTELDNILGRILCLISQLPDIGEYIQEAYPSQSELDAIHDGPENDFLWFRNVRPRGLLRQPKARDTALALVYVFALLLKTLLDPILDSQDKAIEANLCAITLCRLSATFPSAGADTSIVSPLLKRSLFWAGMILKTPEFPIGN